jgi:hypothetical protein
MVAAFPKDNVLHIVKWTGRVKLHAGVIGYCDAEANAAEGVLQVPDQVFQKGVPFTLQAGVSIPPCGKCRIASQVGVG